MVALGIDLGTTNCCVAVVIDGSVKVLENCEGNRTTPSIIGFGNNEITIGETAKRMAIRSPDNVIYDVKRFIGRNYKDPQVQQQIKNLPYKIIEHKEKLKIFVKQNGQYYYPEQLSGILLKQLKKQAEDRLDKVIENVVITVPSYFKDSQRQATIDAGKIAGFKEVNLLNEPTAASIHYGLENKFDDGRVILVFDFGGGTFDISILKYCNNSYEVLAIDGDAYLGGANFDNILVDFVKKNVKIKKSGKGYNRTLARLKSQCEEAKIILSSTTATHIELTDLKIDITLTRDKFNDLSKKLINKCVEIVKKYVDDDDFPTIDYILLVGGSTRIRKIKEELKEKIKGIEVKLNINVDEAVASGAAIYAAKLYDNQFKDLQTVNISQNSLGVQIEGGKMDVLIHKFSKLPAKITKKYQTVTEKQDIIDLRIFSGDDPSTKNNDLIGELRVSGIKSGPNGAILYETFEIDENGILNVSAVDEEGRSTELVVNLNKGRMTLEEIENYRQQLNL